MSKHLQSVVKECRHLLEKDFTIQLKHQKNQQDRTYEKSFEQVVEETALAFLLELAVIRCVEEQLQKNSSLSVLSFDDGQMLETLSLARQRLRATFSPLCQFLVSLAILPSKSTVKTLFYHFGETITSDEWCSDHILGWIYQAFLDNTPKQKQRGQFYTPESIADYIVSQTLDMIQFENIRSVSSFSVLDLACGSGAFSLKAFEQFYARYQQLPECPIDSLKNESVDVPHRILKNHLFLVDNDPWACQISAINLYLKAKRLEPNCHIGQMNIFCVDALKRWEHAPDPQSTNGQGTTSDNGYDAENFHNIKSVFTRKYDIVVGNPPYIVINQLRTAKELIHQYQSYQSAAFKINTFALFVERGIELLKPDAILGMIVPNTLLTQVYFEPLRQYILETSTIRYLLDTKRMFDNAFVENCILLLQREHNEGKRRQNVIECRTKRSTHQTSTPRTVISSPDSIEPPVKIPQRHFEKAPFYRFHVHIDEQSFALMEKMANGNPTLGELCESHDGVNPGNAKKKFIVSERLDDTCKKVLNGKNIGRYYLKWGGLYVRYNRQLLSKGDNVRWGHARSLNSTKIVTRQTADRIIGTIDYGGEYYATNSIHTTILRDGVQKLHLKYLLALLNSKLMSFYYRKLISEAGQLFAQVKLVNLRQLPIRQASLEEQTVLIQIVNELLQMNNRLQAPQTLPPGMDEMGRILIDSRMNDDILDQKIYKLYHLSSEEIQCVEHEMGPAVSFYPHMPSDELMTVIPFKRFQQQFTDASTSIFQMAECYQVHPKSILGLWREYCKY